MEIPEVNRVIKIGDEEIVLDSKLLEFNEATLSKFLDNLGKFYDYFGSKLADLEYLKDRYEGQVERIYAEVFTESKEKNGDSDKLADSKAKSSPAYIEAKEQLAFAKHQVVLLKQHLKAWDNAAESAQNRGHTLRKEMDKLNTSIFRKEKTVDDIVRGGSY